MEAQGGREGGRYKEGGRNGGGRETRGRWMAKGRSMIYEGREAGRRWRSQGVMVEGVVRVGDTERERDESIERKESIRKEEGLRIGEAWGKREGKKHREGWRRERKTARDLGSVTKPLVAPSAGVTSTTPPNINRALSLSLSLSSWHNTQDLLQIHSQY